MSAVDANSSTCRELREELYGNIIGHLTVGFHPLRKSLLSVGRLCHNGSQ